MWRAKKQIIQDVYEYSASMALPKPIWTPANGGKDSNMYRYRQHVNKKFSLDLPGSQELCRWTIDNPQEFWLDIYGWLEVQPPLPKSMKKAYDDTIPMRDIPLFYKGAYLNYTENVLTPSRLKQNKPALIEIKEGGDLKGTKVSWAELGEKVRIVRSALLKHGIKEKQSQRVAAIVSNSIWAVVLFLATASLGAVFTSINPDLGEEGCISRLTQVTPSIIFADDSATYKGKKNSVIKKLEGILKKLGKHQPEVFVIPVSGEKQDRFKIIDDFLSKASPNDKLEFARVPFNHPLIICYSSGTTGPPKCIVHHHGLILQLLKVSVLHNSLGPEDVVMQYTTTTWVMFYIFNGHFATGATVICYDGSPMWPDVKVLLRILETHKVTYFGSSPRYLLELEQSGCVPKKEFDISALKMINTTGAPLALEQYKWFYETWPSAVHISNTAGGTDTATSIIASDPCGPLYAGEMQMLGLGMACDVADPETGDSIRDTGKDGEMVVRKPFPSMPPYFWGDSDYSTYRSSYFEKFEKHNLWAQHDWLCYNPETRGWVMTGRSDGVLNPSGIRFGSGEIYAISEGPKFNNTIAESLCVGRRRPQDTDEQVFLFIKMKDGVKFSEELVKRLKEAIALGLSPRHIPKFMIEVDEIPVTVNGKKVEVAVKKIISGKDVPISSTVANPDCLRGYKRYRDFELGPKAKL